MIEHTPGPWRLEYHATQEGKGGTMENWVIGGDGHLIIKLPAWSKVQQANARLIAAAPDLLDALESVIDRGDADSVFATPVLKKAREAIAKARGSA